MRALSVGLSVLVLAVTGCVDEDAGRDRDGDGFRTVELGGDDCDDANPNVNPAASEACGNGIDDNCDGVVDDAGVGQVDWYVDGDGDGFPSDVVFQSCSPPDGSFADLTRGVDCDDNNNTINPGADEVYYDGVDQDCAGGDDDDADLDGHAAVAQGGDDCDDTNGSVNPSAVEVCNNGVDDDCDGGPGPCEYRGDVVVAEVVLPRDAQHVEWADMTGDGVLDLVASTVATDAFDPPRVQIYDGLGIATGDAPLFSVVFPAGTSSPEIMVDGDYSGDGIPDLVIRNPSRVHIFESPFSRGSQAASSADVEVEFTGEDSVVFTHVAAVVGLAGGVADVLAVFGSESPATADGFVWTLDLQQSFYNVANEPFVAVGNVVGGQTMIPGGGASAFMVEGPNATVGTSVVQYYNLLGVVPPVLRSLDGAAASLEPPLLGVGRVQTVNWDGDSSVVLPAVAWFSDTGSATFAEGYRVGGDPGPGFGFGSLLPSLNPVATTGAGPRAGLGYQFCDVNADGELDAVATFGESPSTGVFDNARTEVVYSISALSSQPTVSSATFSSDTNENVLARDCNADSAWLTMSIGNPATTFLVPPLGL